MRGRVQGVFFRQSTRDNALLLDIRGTVQNQADGSVFIEAEGAPENMELFLACCRKGPIAARVDEVEIHETMCKRFSSFEIVRH